MTRKEVFINTINNLELQWRKDITFSKTLGLAFPNAFEANLLPDNSLLYDTVINFLRFISDDEDHIIEYFIWELDFGKKSIEYEVNIHNSVDLWNEINGETNGDNN